MAKSKIDPADLQGFLDAGHSQAAAARRFGVSQAAIHQRVKKMGRLTSQVLALEKAGQFVDEKSSALEQLRHVQSVIRSQLSWAEQEAKRAGADRTGLIDVIVKLSGEIRQQLALHHAITRTLFDIGEIREFQRTVVEAIREEAPDTAQRIVDRLKQRRVLRVGATLPLLDGGPNGDVA